MAVASALPSAGFWSLHFIMCVKSPWCLGRHVNCGALEVKAAVQEEETWCEVLLENGLPSPTRRVLRAAELSLHLLSLTPPPLVVQSSEDIRCKCICPPYRNISGHIYNKNVSQKDW